MYRYAGMSLNIYVCDHSLFNDGDAYEAVNKHTVSGIGRDKMR